MNSFELNTVSKMQTDFMRLGAIAQSGMARYSFDVGSTIGFKLKSGRDVVARVVDFDVYREHEVIFVMEDLYWWNKMNRRDTNAGGWADSAMALYMEEILADFPDELVDIIKPRTITQHLSGEVKQKTSKLWIPSIIEVGENGLNDRNRRAYLEQEPDNKQFEWFKKARNRIKSLESEDGSRESAYAWWGRSPVASNAANFMNVTVTGNPNGNFNASSALGVAVGFSI